MVVLPPVPVFTVHFNGDYPKTDNPAYPQGSGKGTQYQHRGKVRELCDNSSDTVYNKQHKYYGSEKFPENIPESIRPGSTR
jgi:hypothetical protein